VYTQTDGRTGIDKVITLSPLVHYIHFGIDNE